MSDNQSFEAEEGSSKGKDFASDKPKLFPQEVSPQNLSYGPMYASPDEELTTMGKYQTLGHDQLPFLTHPRNLPNSDVASSVDALSDRMSTLGSSYGVANFVNELSSRRRDENIRIRNEIISSGMEDDANHEIPHLMEQLQQLNSNQPRSTRSECTNLESELSSSSGRNTRMEFLSSGRYEDNCMRGVLQCGRDDVRIGNMFPSSRPDDDVRIGDGFPSSRPDLAIPLSESILDNRLVDIANQLLAVGDGNDQPAENSDFTSYVSPNDISMEYRLLYSQRCPENYDFAMNIMAYIELLNDSSWNVTVSYFDENIKRLVKCIWNEKQVTFNNTIDLKGFDRVMAVKLMVDFTQWSMSGNFDLGEFLNFCVLICQVAVIARKHIFKEASLYAICQLRDRIKLLKFENFVQFMFEIVVKEYAQRLVDHLRI